MNTGQFVKSFLISSVEREKEEEVDMFLFLLSNINRNSCPFISLAQL